MGATSNLLALNDFTLTVARQISTFSALRDDSEDLELLFVFPTAQIVNDLLAEHSGSTDNED